MMEKGVNTCGRKAIKRGNAIYHSFLKLVVYKIDKNNDEWWFYISSLFHIVVINLKRLQYKIKVSEKT